MKSKNYFIRYAQSTSDLFGCVVATDGTDILRKILTDDFLKRRELSFINPRNGKRYQRRYGMMVQGGMAVIDVGEYVGKDFVYAMVGINLSHRMYDPYVQIICMDKAFSNIAMIADMVRQSLNWALSEYGITVLLEPCRTRIEWEVDFVHSYLEGMRDRPFNPMNRFGFEMLEQRHETIGKNAPQVPVETDLLKNYIRPTVKHKDKLIAWLVSEEKGKTQPKDIMRPLRLLLDHKKLYRPTIASFNRICHKEGLISVSSFNDYMNPRKDVYDDDEAYRDMEESLMKECW